jgi:dsRNA-specific ribonuclease
MSRSRERRQAAKLKRMPIDENERYALEQCLTHQTEQQEKGNGRKNSKYLPA